MKNTKYCSFNGQMIRPFLLERLLKRYDAYVHCNEYERLTLPDMAIKFGVSETTLKKHLKLLDIKLHNKKAWSIADKSNWKELITPMVLKGMLYRDIAKEVGSSTAVVYNWCVRNNIDRKTLIPHSWSGRHK